MEISSSLTDEALLQALGERLARLRVGRQLTQAALAAEAGVSKRTIERLERGEAAVQLSGFLRICRALGVLEGFEQLLPDAGPTPMEQLRRQAQPRQRVRKAAAATPKPWTWDDAP